jgi:hypothetical protein
MLYDPEMITSYSPIRDKLKVPEIGQNTVSRLAACMILK